MSRLGHWVVCSLALVFVLCWAAPSRAAFYTYGSGDTFFGTGPDLVSINAIYDATTDNFVFTAGFANPISAPSAFNPVIPGMFGYLDLDVDQNAATGVPSFINLFGVPGPSVTLGSDFYLNLYSEVTQPGQVDVVDSGTNGTVGLAAITYASNSFTVTVSRSLLTGSGTTVNFDLLVGTVDGPSDRSAPDGNPEMTSVVPAPASLFLLLTGLPAVVLLRNRRKAAAARG